MDPSSSIPNIVNVPPLWELNDNKEPKDATVFLDAIKFLDGNENWVKEHQEDARKYIDLLAKTKIPETESETRQKADKIQETLRKKHLDLFDLITVNIGVKERKIPRSILKEISKKFGAMLSPKYKEGQEKVMALNAPEGINEDVLESFLNYAL